MTSLKIAGRIAALAVSSLTFGAAHAASADNAAFTQEVTKQNAIYKSAKTGVTRSMPHRIFHSYSLDGNFMRWSGRWSRRKWRIYVYLLGCLAGHDPATSCSTDIRSPVH